MAINANANPNANACFPESFPASVIVFAHGDPDCEAERVPYMTGHETVTAFSDAVKSGMDPARIYPYVRADRADIAQEIIDASNELAGGSYPVYQLTPGNLEAILNDHIVIIETND